MIDMMSGGQLLSFFELFDYSIGVKISRVCKLKNVTWIVNDYNRDSTMLGITTDWHQLNAAATL